MEAPHLVTLYNKFRDRDFTVLAINSWDEDAKTVARFVKDKGLTCPVLMNGSGVAGDWGVISWPTNFLIDRGGKIVQKTGAISENDLPGIEKTIERLLQ